MSQFLEQYIVHCVCPAKVQLIWRIQTALTHLPFLFRGLSGIGAQTLNTFLFITADTHCMSE